MKEIVMRMEDDFVAVITALEQATSKLQIISIMDIAEQVETPIALIKSAIITLKNEKVLRRKYDFAWIKLALEYIDTDFYFDSAESFRKFLIGLFGEDEVPSESTISKKMSTASGELFAWRFSDCLDEHERQRRNNIVKRFHVLMRGRK